MSDHPQDFWQEMENIRHTFTDNTHISRELLEAMLEQHKAVADERDALKAHILSLTDQLDEETILDSYVEIQEWFERKPEVSLERVKLLAQADILDYAGAKFSNLGGEVDYSEMDALSDELRKKARQL